MSKDTSHSWKAWLLVSVILLLVVAGAVILLRILPAGSSHSHSANNQISSISTANRGVKLEISYNGGSATCYYQQASFYLKEGESLHPQVPSGEFTVALHVPIAPGKLRTARVGATFSGCAVTVLRDEKILIYRKEAEEERITVFSDAMAIASRNAVVTYVIESNGGPIRFRALWQPLGATASFLLPAANENWSSSDQLSEGLSIIQKLNCVSCHKSSDPKLNQLLKGGACPDLSIAASKLNHDWMVKWITDPAKTKTDSTMPMVLKAGTTKDTVEDIIHYLKSIGEDTQTNSTIEIDDALIQSGMMYYHKIGCVACHGPMDKELELEGSYRKLPDLSQKFTVEHLSAFLFDPVKWRPDGRMPSLKLNNQEATAIAAYLLSEGISKTVVENDLTDPERIERGEAAFVQNLCYQCHETGSTLTSTVTQDSTFTPFESLVNNLDAGCLSDDNSKHSVRYNLSDEVKLAIRDFIKNTSDSTVTNVKMLSLAATIKRLNCTACHSWGGRKSVV